MLLWTKKPTRRFIEEFIAAQALQDFSHAHVGASAGAAPAGFVLDVIHTRLGAGQSTFARATAALRAWRHFDLEWAEICWPETPVEPGRTVAVLARVLGCWWLNACRITEVIDVQVGATRQFGFVYDTLPDHAESGEERFCVTWNDDDSVWYSIRAFSRPNQFLSRLGHPLVRRTQKRFARDSSAAMVRCCAPTSPK